jgi:hypothetical protein
LVVEAVSTKASEGKLLSDDHVTVSSSIAFHIKNLPFIGSSILIERLSEQLTVLEDIVVTDG